MTLYILIVVLWAMAMLLATHVFCGAARKFVSSHEREPVPINGHVKLGN